MSKSNQRKIDCFHEAGHAVQAWIEGIKIIELRLLPEHETGELSATTEMGCPAPTQWTGRDLVGHIRTTLAGPLAERLGPIPATAAERECAKDQDIQHSLKAMSYVHQLGADRIADQSVPKLVESARQDVVETFKYTCVVRCVGALARELLRRKSIAGADVEDFIASRITEEQRATIHRECCLTKPKKVQGDPPTRSI